MGGLAGRVLGAGGGLAQRWNAENRAGSKTAAVTPRGWAGNGSIGHSGGGGGLAGVGARDRGGLGRWLVGGACGDVVDGDASVQGHTRSWKCALVGDGVPGSERGGGSAGCAQATPAKPDRTVRTTRPARGCFLALEQELEAKLLCFVAVLRLSVLWLHLSHIILASGSLGRDEFRLTSRTGYVHTVRKQPTQMAPSLSLWGQSQGKLHSSYFPSC